MTLMVKKLLGHFMKKSYKKQTKKNLELKKESRKVISYMSNGKDMIIHLLAGLIKKT